MRAHNRPRARWPAAPATQPSPKIGTRLMLRLRPIWFTSFASIEGLATPLIETKKNAEGSFSESPARVSAWQIASRPSSHEYRSRFDSLRPSFSIPGIFQSQRQRSRLDARTRVQPV